MSRFFPAIGLLVGFGVAFLGTRLLWPSAGTTDPALGAEEWERSSAPVRDEVELVGGKVAAREAFPIQAVEGRSQTAATPTPSESSAVQLERPESARGTVVCGTVRDEDGAPLAMAYILARGIGDFGIRARADEDGMFTVGPLPPGSYEVHAGARGFRAVAAQCEVGLEDELLEMDFVLRDKQVIRVRVATPEGDSAFAALAAAGKNSFLIGLVPVATREHPGDTFTGVTGSLNNTFGVGSFWTAGFHPDVISQSPDHYGNVTLHKPGGAWMSLVCAHQVLASQPIDGWTEEVVFCLSVEDVAALNARIRLQVLDGATGQPVAASVWVEDEPFLMGPPTCSTDGFGGAELADILPGKRWLHVRAEGYAYHSQQILVGRGQELVLDPVALQRPVELAGVVTDGGQPRSDATVTWGVLDERTGRIEWAERTSAGTNEEGRFRIPFQVPALYVVQAKVTERRGGGAQKPTMATHLVRADARLGSVLDLELPLCETAPLALVHGEVEEPFPVVQVLDADGLQVAWARVGRPNRGLPDSIRVLPGTYSVVLTRAGQELRRLEIELGASGQRVELD